MSQAGGATAASEGAYSAKATEGAQTTEGEAPCWGTLGGATSRSDCARSARRANTGRCRCRSGEGRRRRMRRVVKPVAHCVCTM